MLRFLVEIYERLTSNKLSFDEVASIIQRGDSHKLQEIIDAQQISDINALGGDPQRNFLTLAYKAGSIECAAVILAYLPEENAFYNNLHSACLSENIEMVRYVIDKGVEINDQVILRLFEVDEIASNRDITTLLLEHVKDVNYRNSYSSTLLICTCKAGNLAAVRMILERGAARDFSCMDGDGLSSASRGGHLDIVKLLLGWNAESRPVASSRIQDAMRAATIYNHISIIKLLVEYGVDVSALSWALLEAVKENKVEAAQYLLDRGADYNWANYDRDTPWSLACFTRSVGLIRLFLARGADPNGSIPRGELPLKAAIFNPECAQLLLEHGADPNQYLADGDTILIFIIEAFRRHGNDAFTLLLGHGADPNLAHATTGLTPLMAAVFASRKSYVKLLLEYGADVTQVDREGRGVLDMIGQASNFRDMVELCEPYIECNKPGAKLLLK